MRVLVVDDSVVVRRLVTDVLSESGLEIAAALSSGDAALVWLQDPANVCDAVVLDVEMPGISGLECVAQLRALGINIPVAMFSTVTGTAKEQEAARTAGADASVRKPANVGSVLATKRALAEELVPTLERITASRSPRKPVRVPSPAETSRLRQPSTPTPLPPLEHRRAPRPQIVVIGSSTGGPDALAQVFSSLRADIDVPIVIAQHMPASFTKLLAERLTRVSKRTVELAEHGMPLQAGKVVMAPGGAHLSLKKEGGLVRCRLSATPDVGIYPSADILFSSAAEIWNASVLGVVLTGMGSDGLAGSTAIHRAGGAVLAQDEESCVVWGMPRAVTEAGIASVLQLVDIAEVINQRVKSRS
jgi:two-component system, chemotaxis family, protein-glutamate methylesterase/glutaminase